MNIEIINQGDDLKSRMAGHSVALYVIKGDCILSENATIPAGSVLKFEDGRIINNRTDGETVTLSGSRIIVDAPKTQIFGSGVTVTGIANDEISAHWFGALGDGVNDDSAAINNALQSAGKSWVVLDNLSYLVKSPIVLKNFNRLRCAGTIYNQGGTAAIVVNGHFAELDLSEVENILKFNGYTLSGILFSGDVSHCNVKVRRIRYFDKAIDITPSNEVLRDENDKGVRGVQYCKIEWQFIDANYGIYIDMYSKMNYSLDGARSWVNENQFNGGRLYCCHGVYVRKPDNHNDLVTNKKVGIINGNVFNSIGFEGEIDNGVKITPITLHDAWHNNFNDLRISEGFVDAETGWMNLTNCGYLNFTIKSLIPYKAVKAVGCNNIKLNAAFCDNNYGYVGEYDKMHVLNLNPSYNTLNMYDSTTNDSYKVLARDIVPINNFNRLYVGAPSQKSVTQTKFLKSLFLVSTGAGAEMLSDKCYISVQDKSTLIVKTEEEIITRRPNDSANGGPSVESISNLTRFQTPKLLICRISQGSKIVFQDNNSKEIEITQDGLYYIRQSSGATEIVAYTKDATSGNPVTNVLSF